MTFLAELPIWVLAVAVFVLRVFDVSLGTVRTISVVQGRQRLAVALGFFEILVWITAISQVITRIHESPLLLVAYAAGFATGNAVGIAIERKMALGACVVRLISTDRGPAVAARIRELGQILTTFEGQGRDGPRLLLYATCPRRDVQAIIDAARAVDPTVFYVVDRAQETSPLQPLPHATGWRALLKKK